MDHGRSERETLLATFSSLPEHEQIVLELFSVHHIPLPEASAVELINISIERTRFTRRCAKNIWRKLFRRFQSIGMLNSHVYSVKCNPAIVEAITRHAERNGRLDRHLRAVYDLRPSLGIDKRGFGIALSDETIYANLRLAVYCNDLTAYDEHRAAWDRRCTYAAPSFSWQDRLFNQPFDKEWLLSRDPQIRIDAVEALIREAHRRLAPIDHLDDVLGDIVSQLPSGHSLRDLTTHHRLLCGDFAVADELAVSDDSATGRLFQGWSCLVRGQFDDATAHLDTALSMSKKAARRRKFVLEGWAGALYVLAMIRAENGARVADARRYVDDIPLANAEYGFRDVLQCAVLLAEGKAKAARSKCANINGSTESSQPPLNQLFVDVVRCWCGLTKSREFHQRVADRGDRAARSGYRWLALEYRRIANRVASASQSLFPPSGSDDDLGTVPLLDMLGKSSPWERSLTALERLSATSFFERSTEKSESRLVWRVALQEGDPTIRPIEQKHGKTGKWSKGRAVSLERLYGRTKVGFLTKQDFAVCAAIEKDHYGGYAAEYYWDYEAAFRELIGHPLVYRLDEPSCRLEIVRSDPHVEVRSKRGVVRLQMVPEPPAAGNVVLRSHSKTRIAVSVFERKHRGVADVLGAGGLAVPTRAKDRIGPAIHSISTLVAVHSDLPAGSIGSTDVVADATLQFLMAPFEDGLRAEPVVRPLGDEGPSFYPGKGGKSVFAFVDGKAVRGLRDLADERSRFNATVAACPSLGRAGSDGTAWVVPDPQLSLEMLEEIRLLGDSVKVSWPDGEKLKLHGSVATDRLALKIRRSKDWFGVDGSLELDSGLVLTLRQVLDLMEKSTGRFLPLTDNEFLALTDQFRRRIEDLSALVDRDDKHLRLHSSSIHALDSIVEDAGSVDSDAAWAKQLKNFREAQSLDPAVPSTLQAELRDYQVEGFKWAARLSAWGAGACLADDMGLGKTLQALTVTLSRASSGPTLVVAPTSVCPNWTDEARRFTPTLNPLQFGRGNRQKMLDDAGPFDLVVCSYGLLKQDVDSLSAVHWAMVVLDEAQAIKNRETMRSRAAMRLVGDARLITTGTPIENHLGELHNLFSFINPGLLGSADSFVKRFANPIHQSGDQAAKTRLKRLIQPFILRRTKSAVLDELPSRTEITLRVEMSGEERALYEALRQRAVEKLDQKDVGSDSKESGHIEVLAEITRLRRACCHPRLVMPESGIAGSKLEAFLTTVEELIENRHKALVFSQFVGHLDIVRAELDRRDIEYRYLDGSTPSRKRKQEIDAFQAGQGSLFLISLRAGGQGLNLTAADYVVHLDPWWNPAVEDQASDRAHRIGQKRPVTIYRLVMKDSIEEKIVDLHRSKRDLADNLLAGTDMSGKMSAAELLNLLKEQ